MQNAERDLTLRTKNFARRIICLTSRSPKKLSRRFSESKGCGLEHPSAQIITEPIAPAPKPAFVFKVGDCLKEADETAYWLELPIDETIVPPQKLEPLLKEANELIAILATLAKRALGD